MVHMSERTLNFDYGLRLLGMILSRPSEAIDKIRGRFERATEGRMDGERVDLTSDRDWDRHVHEALGHQWPCDQLAGFRSIWQELSQSVEGVTPLGTGHDADAALVRALWCLVRHLQPARVVETGVARGISTRIILEALEANGHGHLWSIDLPPLLSSWHAVATDVIPARLRSRWTFVRGSSRRRLPALLRDLPEIDLFVHDSLHTEANMAFEFATAWPALRPSGVLVSDDVQLNRSFGDFVTKWRAPFIVAQEDSKPFAFGIAFRSAEGAAREERAYTGRP